MNFVNVTEKGDDREIWVNLDKVAFIRRRDDGNTLLVFSNEDINPILIEEKPGFIISKAKNSS